MRVPVVHVVATDGAAERDDFLSAARGILRLGGAHLALHLRLKRAPARRVHALARELAGAAREHGAWCVINERLDVALCVEARAVQLGVGSLPVAAARRVGGTAIAIGCSVHSAAEARARVREGADYLVAGPIFATATHPGAEPAGVELIAECAGAGAPVVGIGGIGPDNASRVMEAGAAGIAVIRAVWETADPVSAAGRLLEVASAAHGVAAGRGTDDARSADGRD